MVHPGSWTMTYLMLMSRIYSSHSAVEPCQLRRCKKWVHFQIRKESTFKYYSSRRRHSYTNSHTWLIKDDCLTPDSILSMHEEATSSNSQHYKMGTGRVIHRNAMIAKVLSYHNHIHWHSNAELISLSAPPKKNWIPSGRKTSFTPQKRPELRIAWSLLGGQNVGDSLCSQWLLEANELCCFYSAPLIWVTPHVLVWGNFTLTHEPISPKDCMMRLAYRDVFISCVATFMVSVRNLGWKQEFHSPLMELMTVISVCLHNLHFDMAEDGCLHSPTVNAKGIKRPTEVLSNATTHVSFFVRLCQ